MEQQAQNLETFPKAMLSRDDTAQGAKNPKNDTSIIPATKTAPQAAQAFKRERRLIDISSGLLKITADTTKLSKAQNWTLLRFLKNDEYNDAMRYLSSFTKNHSDTSHYAKRHLKQWSVQNSKSKLKINAQDILASKQTNSIGSLYQKLLANDYQAGPHHIGQGDAIGVEIECFVKSSSQRAAIGSVRTSLSFMKVKRAYVKTDGSLRVSESWNDDNDFENCGDCNYCNDDGDHDNECSERQRVSSWYAVEVVVMFSKKDPKNLVNACQALKNLKARVNKSCGLHVHLDARDVSNVDTRSARIESMLHQIMVPMVPVSRRDNEFCELGVSPKTLVNNSDRYFAINRTSFAKHRTLEIRLHSGTIDATKIINWATILRAAQEKSRGYVFDTNDSQYDKINYFCDKSGLGSDIKNYIINRQREFSPELFGMTSEPREESENAA